MSRTTQRRIAQANAEAQAAVQDQVADAVLDNVFEAAAAAPVPVPVPVPVANGNAYAAAADVLARANVPVARNYTVQEMSLLCDCVGEVMPQGLEEWTEVERLFKELYHLQTGRTSGRDMLSLKRCFTRLRSKSVPTGDPNCPDHVRRAKRIYWDIVELSGAVGGRNVRPRVLAEPVAEQEAAEAGNGEEADDEGGEPDAPLEAPRPSIQRGRRNHREMNEFERKIIERMERREEESRQNREVFNRFLESQVSPQRDDDGIKAILERLVTQQEEMRAQINEISSNATNRPVLETPSPAIRLPSYDDLRTRNARRIQELLESSSEEEEDE